MTAEDPMPKTLFVVLHNAVEGEDAALDHWYNVEHIPDAVAAAPRFTAATRYRLSDVQLLPGAGVDGHRYLTVYELEGESDQELTEAADSLRAVFFGGATPSADEARSSTTADNAISPALDLASIAASFAVPVMERHAPGE
jgi:hypothetical protein